ncbi:transposon-encoded TnpW family protein [Agathobaculum sp. NSJ-28]|uniref:Transposon-encoded TnpW family protein n=2 Tax=Butyricicoccaceae TaxID=3085642 RepID=A0A923LTL2_9FIRM|nr:transposon-encoded TnpW family protein [Agathobaculum faecis]
MTKAERLNWFRKSQYPYSINFDMKIGNTVYSVSSHFNRTANESLQEKAQRIILNKL